MPTPTPIRTALVSVFDKTGLEPLAHWFKAQGVKVFSTGGTARHLESLGLEVTLVESVTGFPEMMDGRVKTLHPKVFGGILARRGQDETVAAEHNIPLVDCVVVNLYPFWEHRKGDRAEQTQYIDIGGPSLLRAAAKNSQSVTVLSDPSDYPELLKALETTGGTEEELRHQLAARTFARTSRYDALIASAWGENVPGPQGDPALHLRYGENPHQKAYWAGEATWKQLQGKDLSYNNLLDTEAAALVCQEFADPAVVIVKHNNPCGTAVGTTLSQAWEGALAGDSVSAFGGIVAVNRELDGKTAEKMAELFLEVVLAPGFSSAALDRLGQKKNLRLIEWKTPEFAPWEVRPALGGWLAQERDGAERVPEEWKTVTQTALPDGAESDLRFAWAVCRHVKSNAIVLAKDNRVVGVGAGQMSRVDSVELALKKAGDGVTGTVLASDAFFPFRDNIDLLRDKGIRAIVQPGGSLRDAEVIQACDEQGIAMVFTGHRHFKH